MTHYLISRLLQLIPVLFVLSILVFGIFRILPGDRALLLMPLDATPEELERARRVLGLDRPIPIQYIEWLGRVLQGNFGVSQGDDRPVVQLLGKAIVPTLQLGVTGLVLGILLAVPMGILGAIRHGSWIDYLVRSISLIGFAVPTFWLALLLMLLFSIRLRVLPVAGYAALWQDPVSSLRHMALPTAVIGISSAAALMRFLRASLLEVLGQDYVRTARSKGLSGQVVILRHALANALIPFTTIVGLQVGALLSGAAILEMIFAWPGIGWLTLQAIWQRDYDIVQGATLMMGLSFVLVNLAVDVLYAYLDPRIKYVKE